LMPCSVSMPLMSSLFSTLVVPTSTGRPFWWGLAGFGGDGCVLGSVGGAGEALPSFSRDSRSTTDSL
jgi:hypothetical protein